MAADDPEIALDWAKTITDVRRREFTQQQCLERWKRDDPAHMEVWLTANPDVPQSVRDRLLKGTGPSGATGTTAPIPGLQ